MPRLRSMGLLTLALWRGYSPPPFWLHLSVKPGLMSLPLGWRTHRHALDNAPCPLLPMPLLAAELHPPVPCPAI